MLLNDEIKEVEMNRCSFAGVAAVALGTGTLVFSQSQMPTGKPQSPDWFLTVPGAGGSSGGNNGFNACVDDIVKYCTGLTAGPARGCLTKNTGKLSGACKAELSAPPDPQPTPACSKSPVCGNRGGGGNPRQRVQWKQTMGYTYVYPFELPPGGGGVSAVDID